ncbi:MAG: TauD/TfdA family dioxygenase, partial [Proteobacteria bacterium]|nr:TauD/TfdA family dioxygenase [Pseudomonadota bacterium]
MSDVHLEPIDHPGAWRADTIGSLDALSFDLEKRHLDALENALAIVQRQGKTLAEITNDDFAMPAIANELAGLRDLLLHGRGLLLVRGWPVERLSVDELGMIYWGLGSHFGKGVLQSAMGDRLGYVTDVSTRGKRERGYRSKAELSLHNDSDDIVGLLCIRQGRSGGMSRLASAMAVHNVMAEECPHLLAPLYEGFHHSWMDARPPGE